MTIATFLFAILALLLTPGPTNTLIFMTGAHRGWAGALRLIPFELLGYLTTILPLAFVGAAIFSHWPAAALALKLVAGFWVLLIAVSLWRLSDHGAGAADLTGRKVYVTTMLNPKALIVALVLLPSPGARDFELKLGMFFLVAAAVAACWSAAGMLSRIGVAGPRRMQLLQRLASLWLTLVSFGLIVDVLKA